ncbi:hypothetical protein L596_010117 [Steinernema carpocapsae]|uniref:G-protein coupled receptors family 1 profile domain-containing protein n=1 Tax=Steinernema carpocapsae TaxID=34508 RepID=A0A4U5PHD2_STECR|nr:hypothetical protein L596_010117 [Steinernema carpocapsae]
MVYSNGTEIIRLSKNFLTFRHVNGAIACMAAVIFNLLIIISIQRMNRGNLRHFRGLLVALSVLDTCYAFAAGVTTMGFDYYNEGFLVVITGVTTFGPPILSQYFYAFYILTFNAFFILQPIIFICRYVIICTPQHIAYFEDKFVLIGGFITACLYCVAQLYSNTNIYTLTHDHPVYVMDETGEKVFNNAVYLSSKNANEAFVIAETLFLNLLIMASVSSMVYCSTKIFIFLKRNASSFTERTRQGQRKLTLALMLQTTFPILTGVVPLYVTFYMIFNQIASSRILWYSMTLHVWQPTFSALITIVFVTPIRRVMVIFGKKPSRIFNVTSGI